MTADDRQEGFEQSASEISAEASDSAQIYVARRDMAIYGNFRESDPRIADLVPSTPVAELESHALGIAEAALPAGSGFIGQQLDLTPYLERPHDAVLREKIDTSATGASTMVLLVGRSTTGKTRALYEAILSHPQVRTWPLFRPGDAYELKALLGDTRIIPGTALWLNETQKYLSGTDGERVARALIRLLETNSRIIVLGAMWQDYYADLVATGQPGDPNAGARELLAGPYSRKVLVPSRMTPEDLSALASRPSADPRMTIAVAASGEYGEVIQHLTGGPELVEGYLEGGLFTPVEQALITAALEARRLGHLSPFLTSMLASGADGYLTERERPGATDWASVALAAITSGARPDGTRTDVRRTLTALTEYRSRAGQLEVAYEPAPFLDQNTREQRVSNLGTRQLWEALVEHSATAEDLYSLGNAAWIRGFFRNAARMWYRALSLRHPAAAAPLLRAMIALEDEALPNAIDWILQNIPLDSPRSVDALVRALNTIEQKDAVSTLATRAANEVELDSLRSVVTLVQTLHRAGADDAVATLVARTAKHGSVESPRAVADLLKMFLGFEADEAAGILAVRAAEHSSVDSARPVSDLLQKLLDLQTNSAVTRLADRASVNVSLESPRGVAILIRTLHSAGADEAAANLEMRSAKLLALTNARGVAILLRELRNGQSHEAIGVLLSRKLGSQAPLENFNGVCALITELGKSGCADQAMTLGIRAAEFPYLWDLKGAAHLVRTLTEAEVVVPSILLEKLAELKDLSGVTRLSNLLQDAGASESLAAKAALYAGEGGAGNYGAAIYNLQEDGANQAVDALVAWMVENMSLDKPRAVASMMDVLARFGADEAKAALAGRAVAYMVTEDLHGICYLIRKINDMEEGVSIAPLAARAARNVQLTSPAGVAEFLELMLSAKLASPIATLIGRNPAEKVSLRARGLSRLAKTLRTAGDEMGAMRLLQRAVDSGAPAGDYLFGKLAEGKAKPADVQQMRRYGREPDGRPSRTWSWKDLSY